MKLEALTAASSSHPSMKRRKCVKATFIEFILSYFDVRCLQWVLWSSGYTVTVQPSPAGKHSNRHASHWTHSITSSSAQRSL